MVDIKIGFCQRCGRVVKLTNPEGKTQRDWDRQATKACGCMQIKSHGKTVTVREIKQLDFRDIGI